MYLVSGDEPLLVGEVADAIRAAARAAGYADRSVFFIDRSFAWDELRHASQSLSLFADRRLFELRMPSGKPDKGAQQLADLAERPPPDVISLVITDKLDKKAGDAPWVRAVEKQGVWVPVWPVETAALPGWLRTRAKQLRVEIEPAAAQLIVEHGWRTAQLILGAAVAVLLVPAAWCVRRPPHLPAAVAAGGMGRRELKLATGRALRSRPFVVLSLTFFACCATHSGPIFHTISYAIGCGLSALTAVTIYSVEGFAGLVGRLVFGFLGDKVGVKRMIVAGLLVQAVAAGAYVLATGLGDFYAVAFVFGMAYGGVMPLYAALARNYFAPQIMGTVLGAMTLCSGLGMALGPALGGWVFDHFHAYTWMYLGSLAVGLGAGAIALALPRVRSTDLASQGAPA